MGQKRKQLVAEAAARASKSALREVALRTVRPRPLHYEEKAGRLCTHNKEALKLQNALEECTL